MGGIFTNRLLLKKNRLLYSYCFLEIFVGDKDVMEGSKVIIIPQSPHWEKLSKYLVGSFHVSYCSVFYYANRNCYFSSCFILYSRSVLFCAVF